MKIYCRRVVFVSLVVAVMATLLPLNAKAESSGNESGLSTWVVPVFLPDIAEVPELYMADWIDLADLPASDRPESAFQGFRLPQINAVYTWHKSVIESLTTNCTTIFIDYEEATYADIVTLPIDRIVAVGICGPQARIVTTAALAPGSNPALIPADLMEFVAKAKASGLHHSN